MNINKIKSGVLLGAGKYDWIAGGNSPIQHDILIPNKDWKQIKVEHEIQWTGKYDTLFCVTYSALKSLAKLLTYLENNGLLSQEQLDFWADYKVNGMYNFSERFSGTLGETTIHGAYQFKVANAIKNYGLIPQSMFELADNFQDNIDKKFITEEMYAKGKKSLEYISINYEWVDNLIDYLQFSPVQTIVKFDNYINPEDILAPEGTLNHAVTGVYAIPEYDEIEDTYWQEFKRYNPDYTHSYMAYYITLNNNKNMDTETFLKVNDKKWIRNYNNGQFGRVLQNKLFTVETKDRGALILLDDKVRENGIQISNEEWEQLPKRTF